MTEEIKTITEETTSKKRGRPANRTPKKKFKPDTPIACRSVRQNILYYKSPSGSRYQWQEFGDIRELPYSEVRSLLVSRSKFLFEPWFIIDDEELMKEKEFSQALGEINALYNDFNDPHEFFNLPLDEMEERLKNAPNGFKELILHNANAYIADGTLDKISVVNLLDRIFDTNLKMML